MQNIGRKQIAKDFGIGLELSGLLLERLEHVIVGRSGNGVRRLAARTDVNAFFQKARKQQIDLVPFIRNTPTSEFRAWFNAEKVAA